MRNVWLPSLMFLSAVAPLPTGQAHEAPINLFVDSATNRLFTLDTFAPGRLELMPGVEISTTTPGIGVSFFSNGLTFGTNLLVDGMPGFHYFDGAALVPTSGSMTWDPPEFDNLNNPTGSMGQFQFSESSGLQLGLPWATYVESFFWEADGTHKLTSLAARAGIYGTVIRMRSTDHLASDPFVVPFIYDPDDIWDLQQEEAAVAAVRALVQPTMPGDFDNDLSFDCRDVDALVSSIASQDQNVTFDLDGDSLVTVSDLDLWLVYAAAHNLLPGGEYRPGDANLDGFVDVSDFNLWNSHRFSMSAAWCAGDFSADGSVDVADFNIWNNNKFTPAMMLVPEPAVKLFWIWGLVLLVGERRASRWQHYSGADR